MKKFKRLVAIISLVMLTATVFMPLAGATDEGETPFAQFTSSAFMDTENNFVVVQVTLSGLEGEMSSSHIKLEYDSNVLTYDHYLEGDVFEGTLEVESVNGKIVAVQIAEDKNITESGDYLELYFTYNEAEAVGTIDFALTAFQVFNADDELEDATAEGCSYTFEAKYGEKEIYTSKAYMEENFLVVEIRLEQLALEPFIETATCFITLNYNDKLLTFDHYEEQESFMGTGSHELLNGAVKVTQERVEEQTLTGKFLKFYFTYLEEAIGVALDFNFDIYRVAPGVMTWAEASGCSYLIYYLGDINGDKLVNTGDAVCLLRHITLEEMLDEEQVERADINGDGVINTGDATKILALCVADD
ncbi:MAG: hypothetical protein GX802_00970 [Clostridiales bacterium]|jgi:hypothetical protein|nr:hypothetical protein [Clostridiales bacterium]